MTDLLTRVRAALAFDSKRIVNADVRLTVQGQKHDPLFETDFTDGVIYEHERREKIDSALLECVAALEWYDNVHRNHWTIDLNHLDKVAERALTSLAKAVESGEK